MIKPIFIPSDYSVESLKNQQSFEIVNNLEVFYKARSFFNMFTRAYLDSVAYYTKSRVVKHKY
jgi:hypothetical protein